jgi:hypothetical protein
VIASDREPLLRFILEALEGAGCRILHTSRPDRAPFRITFETSMGERMGIVAYAFLANTKLIRNRPIDEHRFQIKYGSKDGELHEIWQDPFELYTTLFLGINPDLGFFVAADPVLHSPTKFFISLEFKQDEVNEVLSRDWHAWERVKRDQRHDDSPIEILVGGTKSSFLRYVRFERAAKGLGPGHRQLLADKLGDERLVAPKLANEVSEAIAASPVTHALAEEFQLSHGEILDLIASAPRLKMAVRGWVAEVHLEEQLKLVPGVDECQRLEEEGGADLRVRYRGSRPLEIECKNVLRQRQADGTMRLDFQRTRASKGDPCSRFYAPTDFDMVAACLHSCTELWEFRYALTGTLDPHRSCPGKLSNLVRIDDRWAQDAELALRQAAER